MREIEITIKPDLSDVNTIDDLREALTKSMKKAEEIAESLVEKEEKEDILEIIGFEILRRAGLNADQGYTGLPFGNATWDSRSAMVEKIYELSPYHTPGLSGLDTGMHQLIDSLKRGHDDNIHDLVGDSIEIGTRFGGSKGTAKLLEEGGIRDPMIWKPLGFDFDGVNWKPKAWLLRALRGTGISVDAVKRAFTGEAEMPARPFLKPAMWSIVDDGTHTNVMASQVTKILRIQEGYGEEFTVSGETEGDVKVV